MAEKPDLSTETVSLPPNYAPSEAFTDSPPPAYQKSGVAVVKVAKIVCITLLMMTFIIGFFVVTHKWVQSNQMHHTHHHESPLPTSEKLIDNKIPEKIAEVDEELKATESKETVDKEVEKEELQEISSIEEVELPPRNPKCKIRRRQNKLDGMMMTQTVMIVCGGDDDEADQDDNDRPMKLLPPGMRRLNQPPPMSLIGNLMKILASRPRSSEIPREDERPIIRPINGPMPFHMMRPHHGPRPFHAGPPGRMIPMNRIRMNRPNQMLEGSNLRPLPQMRPIPIFRKIIMGSPHPFGPPPPPHFFLNQKQEEEERTPMSIPLHFPNGAIPIRVIRLPMNINNEDDQETAGPRQLPPFHPLMNLIQDRRARIIHLRPREEENNRPQIIFSHRQEEENRPPMPFPMSIRVIRPPTIIDNEDEQRNDGPPPFPFQPLINLVQNRRARMFQEKFHGDEEHNAPHFTRELPPIHLPPPSMPMEARGRALPSPVAIPDPEMRVIRFPFQPQPQSFNIPEARVSAGIMIQSEEDQQREQPIIIEESSNKDDFGPPKTHSVIEAAPQDLSNDEEETQFHPRFLARRGPLNFSSRRISFEPSDAVIPSDLEPAVQPINKFHRMIIN